MTKYASSLALILLAALILAPYLTTGYYQDDSINSVLPAYLTHRGMTLWQFLGEANRDWALVNGRLFPIGLSLGYLWWGADVPLWLYRATQVGLVIGCVALWARTLEALGSPKRLALLCALCVLPCFQLRDYHDPVASYAFLMQWAFLQGAASVCLLRKHQREGGRRALWASLALFATSLLTYEASLAFYPVLACIAFGESPSELASAPSPRRWAHSAVLAVYLAGALWLRTHTQLAYAGTQSSLSLKAFRALAVQASGVFPLIYSIFGRSDFYSGQSLLTREFWSPLWTIAGAGVAATLAARRLLREGGDPAAPVGASRAMRWSGAALWLIPAGLIAATPKYQAEIHRIGHAYIPVFLSCFGFSIFFALGLRRLARASSPSVAAGLFGALTAITAGANFTASRKLNLTLKDPRALVEDAFRSGLLAELPAGTRLAVTLEQGWLSEDFILHHSGRSFPITRVNPALPSSFSPPVDPKARWLEIDLAHRSVRLRPESGPL